MLDTFAWSYLRHSPLRENWFVLLVVSGMPYLTRPAEWWLPIVAALFCVIVMLGGNYICWLTIGRALTTSDERRQLSVDERAKLAWKFWWRPARMPKP